MTHDTRVPVWQHSMACSRLRCLTSLLRRSGSNMQCIHPMPALLRPVSWYAGVLAPQTLFACQKLHTTTHSVGAAELSVAEFAGRGWRASSLTTSVLATPAPSHTALSKAWPPASQLLCLLHLFVSLEHHEPDRTLAWTAGSFITRLRFERKVYSLTSAWLPLSPAPQYLPYPSHTGSGGLVTVRI